MKTAILEGFWDDLKKVFRPWYHPANLWYSFKCWAWRRYTTIKPRYMPHTWQDRTEVLPHMMFEILSIFIEEECSPGQVEWYGDMPHMVEVNGVKKNVRDEMQELYDWWHNEYHGRYSKMSDYLHDELAKLEPYRGSHFSEDPELGLCVWDPQFTQEWAKKRDKDLLMYMNDMERYVTAALTRRMHRIVNLCPYLWT